LKVRHFTDGGAVGSKGFVDAVFGMWRERFGKNRKTGARKLRGADWGELRALRDLQR
jgi:putative transposase